MGRWLRSMSWLAVWSGACWYAVYHIHNAWGMVILAGLYVSAFCALVNTVDLLCGRWLRRGQAQRLGYQPRRIRRIIIEEEI